MVGPKDPGLNAHVLRLLDGNRDYVRRHGRAHRNVHAHGQTPFVAAVECSDSRDDLQAQASLPLGCIFDLKNAGNIVNPSDSAVVGSLVYYARHLSGKNRLLAVMGHYGCGGIKALDQLGHLEAPIRNHLKWALPAKRFVDAFARRRASDSERHRLLVEANVLAQLCHLMSVPALRSSVKAGSLTLLALVSDVATGELHADLPALRRHGLLTDAIAHFRLTHLDVPARP